MSKKFVYLTIFVVLLGLVAAPAFATDYYVAQNDPAADDSNPGTEALPWETLLKACETVVAGDTVYVKAGTYIDTVNQWYKKFHVTNNGTAANPITFISTPQHAAVVRSASLPGSRSDHAWGLGGGSEYIIIDGFKIEGGIVVAYDRADYCTIRNCELIYGWCASDPGLNWGITLYWANHCTVENNYVHDITSSGSGSRNGCGIMLFGDPSKIEFREPCQYNVFQGNTVDTGGNVRNAYGMKAGKLNNNIWRYNVAMNSTAGFHGMGNTGETVPSEDNIYYQNIAINCGNAFDLGYVCYRFIIYNNTAVDCDTFLGAYRGNSIDTEMWNNILVGTNDTAIDWQGYPDAMPFTSLIEYSNYNCFYNCNKIAYREKSPTLNYYTLGDWQSGTGFDMDSIVSNPLLVGGGDYHLQTGSPCINAGVDLQDYDDDQNTSESIDMGAYITGNEIIGHNWGPTPPGQATSPSPSDSATDVSVTADLSWTAGSGSTSSDVYFGTDSTPDSGEFQGNQTATTYDPGTMSNNTTYYWRIDEVNAEGTTTGNVWSFTTESAPQPPGQATNPSPADSATDVSINADLSWTAGSGATSHDVYFGTSSPGTFQGNQAGTTFDLGTMAESTTYYWRIDEINAQGTTTGNVWSFTTEAAPSPPGQASNPSPADSATDVSITADLSWSAGSGATSHDVYFGTSSPGTFQGNQTETTFDAGTMANDTTYYWRIDEVNAAGTTTGNVWSFATETTGGGAPIEFDNVSSNAVTGASTTLSWSHTVGSGSDRILIVGIAGEDSSESDLVISSVTYGSANMTFVSGSSATGGTGAFKIKTELYYLLNPGSGTDIVAVTYSGPVTSRAGGAISLANVEQQAAEAVATNTVKSGDTISTNVTTQTDGAWVVDVVGCGNSGSFITTTSGMTERFDVTTVDSSGAGSTKPVSSAGSTTMSWEHTGANRMALSVAAFAPTGGGGPQPPGQATNPSPADSATDISIDADLSWTAGTDSTSSDVYLGIDSTPDSGEFQGNQTETTFDPGTLANDTTYYWRIDEVNAGGTTTGTVWNFTTIIAAPSQASSPDPADSATDVSIDADLSWTAGTGSTSSDVYFGTSSPGDFQGNQTATTFDPGAMTNDTTYYWRIDEVNAGGTTTGTVWSFTTEATPQPPGQASGPNPADSATDVSIDADLSWTAGTGSTSSDVYFGTSSPGTFQGNQTATTYDPGTMANDTTYYWRIDEVNAQGTTTGNVWSFTTVTAGGQVTEEFGDAVDTNYPGTIEDTFTKSGSGGDDNWSTYLTLNTYTWPADTIANTTIIKWDLSAISTDATVVEATLYLYQVETGGDTSYDIGVHKIVNVDPNITTCTWNTYDGTNSWTGGADGGQSDIAAAEDAPAVNSTNNEYKTWTVTNMVQDWVSTPSSNYGMLVNSDGVASTDSYRFFASNEDSDTSIRPKLIVTYSAGAAPPGQATNPSPADSATDVSINADLSWTAGSGSTSSDVYFGTSSPGTFQGNQTATTYDPGTMSNDTTYYWRIDEVNAQGTTTGTVWSFTTIVAAPGAASSPGPADSTADVSINADLSWSVGSGATSHDVYFGTSSPGTFQGNQTAITFDPGTMSSDTTYYWRIDEVNAGGTTTGTVWNFTTIVAAPGQASSPSPADSTTDISVSADLSWTAGSGAASHDVYFGTTSPGTFQGNQTATIFDPGAMANDTTYYWRIDEVNAGGTTTGTVWSFTTIVAPPGSASSPSPADSTTDVGIDADLSWSAGTGATSHDVYFGTSSPGNFQGNQVATTFDPGTMANDATYYWRIDEVNAGGTTTGTVWSFTTIVAAPGAASSPSPADSATDVGINTDLSWTAGSGATSRDVYFGTSSPGASQGNQTATTFDTGTMVNNTTYYWRIDEINAGGTTTGTVWSFTTIVAAPGQASSPSPGNGATDVDINANLSWAAGSGAASHDVYFGTTSPGSFQGNQTATTFDPGTMSNDTTYYWHIDEVNAGGTTTGTVWSFTTIVAAPGQASSPSPADSATDVSVDADLSWTAGSGATSHDVYFGTTSPGTFQGNQTATTYDPGTMSNDTTYYWRIDEVNAQGTTTGTVWSFTTETVGGGEPIEFDNVSSNAEKGYSTTLSWSHTVGSGSDRILIVGIAGEDSSESDLVISSVTYGSANMTFVSGSSATGGTGAFKIKTELYYLLNPDSGTDTVTVTYSGDTASRVGGAVSLFNVEQQAAEAVATNTNVSTNTISTNITTQTDGAWVVDIVGCGNSGSFTTTTSGMVERFDDTTTDSSGAGSTKPVSSAGSTTMSWEHTGANRMALSAAAFAPAD